ncbi:MAG: A/G-specific adenine glycosylase [Siculibacillus sp.]|nr:A/G-specific adenine glycosylase [Siculibacillus sp.]
MTRSPAPFPAATLLAWYDRHHRRLPWRVGPDDRAAGEIADPYRVWLSEVMLQQTTVAAVKSYFEAFIVRWPSVAALAAADEAEVTKAWAGLGYYSRARNLLACARAVVADHGGRFPESEEGLRALPGVGPYTAAAIATIAFDRAATVVDGNVERVVARLFAVEAEMPAAKPELRRLAATLTPSRRPGDFAQAMMDLGATLCTPRKPACGLCPWAEGCAARALGAAETFPRRAAKPGRPTRTGFAFVALRADGAVLLRRRPPKGLLGGMSEPPGSAWVDLRPGDPPGGSAVRPPFVAAWERMPGEVEHTFTHFHLRLVVMRARVAATTPAPDGHWWSPAGEVAGEALPTVFRKALAAAGVESSAPSRAR